MNKATILDSDEMAEMICLIKDLKGARPEEKGRFFRSLFGGSGFEWEELIADSQKESVNAACVKKLLANYDPESLRFKGCK